MKLNQLTIEELVELRTQMILEKKSTKQINQIIDKKEKEYIYSIIEDTSATGGPAGAVSGGDVGSGGVAFANAGIGGMGDVTSAQPSSYAGSTIGSNWANHGGTIGSGDISNPFPGPDKLYQKTPVKEMGKNHGARTGKKSRVKKLDLKSLRTLAKKQDYTTSAEPKGKRVMNFDDFQKQGLSKVTKVKENLNQINQRKIFSDKEVVGKCPECDHEITNNDIYSGSFFCEGCGKDGHVYELNNLNM
jgi:hypothetical protein